MQQSVAFPFYIYDVKFYILHSSYFISTFLMPSRP